MNTKIDRIARHQSRLGGFVPSPSPESAEESFFSGYDYDDDANGSGSSSDDEVKTSQ